MTRTGTSALRRSRHDRILAGVAEINAQPVVHRWKVFDALNEDTDML